MSDPIEKAITPAGDPSVPVVTSQTAATIARSDPNGMSFGPMPQMTGGMTFQEIGSSGLRQFSGWVREEFLQQLTGRQGAQKYREMIDNSPIVGAVLFAINASLRKVEWRVTPVNESGQAAEAADFVESLMGDMSHTWEDLVAENISMLPYGYAPHEIVYKRRNGENPGKDPNGVPGDDELPTSQYDDGLIGWRRIPLRGQDTVLKWFFDPNGGIKGMTQQPWTGPIIDLPIEKMLLFRVMPHKNNPEARSVLRTAYVPYYFVKRLQEQEAILAERLGGIPVIKIPSEIFTRAAAGDANATLVLNQYKRIATNIRIDEQMGVVLPSDTWAGANGPSSVPQYAFELVTPQTTRAGVDFDKTITRYNTSIMTAVLADFLALGHEARGTQSLAVSKVDMFFQAIEGYLNSMAAVYNRYALPRLWKLNGMNRDVMPKIEPDLAQRVDLDVLSNFVLRLSQSGMPLFPNEELQSYLLDAGGLPDVQDEAALQAAGMTQDQLDNQDAKDEAMLDNIKNPPQQKPGGPSAPGKTNLEKMLLAGVARRMIRKAGPKFGIHTHKRKRP